MRKYFESCLDLHCGLCGPTHGSSYRANLQHFWGMVSPSLREVGIGCPCLELRSKLPPTLIQMLDLKVC